MPINWDRGGVSIQKKPITKGQHYVWAHYLRAWAGTNTFVCFRRSQNKFFSPNPNSIAKETFFYRTYTLTQADKLFLQSIIDVATASETRDLHQRLVYMYSLSGELAERIKLRDHTPEMLAELRAMLEEVDKTMGEQYHMGVEEAAKPILSALRNQSDDFYEDAAACTNFLYFLCNQYFRTAKMGDLIASVSRPISGHDPIRTRVIETHIYATNVSLSLFLERKTYGIVFLKNDTAIPFITSDQPVINLLAEKTITKDVEFYYPLSPTLAMLLTKDQNKLSQRNRSATAFEVEHYNFEMFRQSGDQLYADNEAYLRKFVTDLKALHSVSKM